MPGRRGRRMRGNRRRGGLPAPGNVNTILWTGTVAAGGTLAFTFVNKTDRGAYRVLWIKCQIASEKPGSVQLGIRGEGPEVESYFSSVELSSVVPRTLQVFQPVGNGYWEPTKETETAGWIRNAGASPVTYTAVAKVRERIEINLAGSLECAVPVLPGAAAPAASCCSSASSCGEGYVDVAAGLEVSMEEN